MSSCYEQCVAEQIATLTVLIAAYNTAILEIVQSRKQSYQLDTGQTRILVTKANLATVRDTRNELMLELSLLCGDGSTRVVPNF